MEISNLAVVLKFRRPFKTCKGFRSREWIDVRPTENDSTRLYKMAVSQLLLSVASSNLVGRTSKCYFIIKFSLLLSIILCWGEIRPDTGKIIKNEFSLK